MSTDDPYDEVLEDFKKDSRRKYRQVTRFPDTRTEQELMDDINRSLRIALNVSRRTGIVAYDVQF